MLLFVSILASVGILGTNWMYGNRSAWGPILGLASQIPWAALILLSGTHGLWLSWGPTTLIHVRNLVKWTKGATP
jgi:hypothetical protein